MEPPMGQPMSKSDEELEVQALRRVISAYLNYPLAAEEDIKRWERSYAKCSPAHKALLPHLTRKYENLRRCVRTNTYFIMNMLQAFDPPFEMDSGIGSNFDEPSPVDRDVIDKIVHTREGVKCCRRDDENTIEVLSYPSPTMDPPVTPLNSNKRQAVENTFKNATSDFPTTELNAFGTRGRVRCCDDWSCTRSEAQANEYFAKPGANGHLSIGDIEYEHSLIGNEHRISDDFENGHPIVSRKRMPDDRVPLDLSQPSFQIRVPSADVDKVRCIVRNIVRDWGEEGALEREQCYLPILEELHRLFPDRKDNRQRPTCLVPGAGLGRLACEISRLGFIAQGNEFSYYMLICSSFILNQSDEAFQWALHPWIHSNCNSLSDTDQLRAVYIPDLHPGRDN